MSEYIYNSNDNLRTTLGRVHYTPVNHPDVGSCFFAVVDCDDKCTGNWDHSKQYCGLVMRQDDVDEVRHVMDYGSKPYSLKTWLNV